MNQKIVERCKKLFFGNSGFAQIPVILGLLIMALAIPVASRLVQTNQTNQGMAVLYKCCQYSCTSGCAEMASCDYTHPINCGAVGGGTAPCGSRASGSSWCEGTQKKSCNNGTISSETCPNGCSANTCSSAPAPTTRNCDITTWGTCNGYTQSCNGTRSVSIPSNQNCPAHDCASGSLRGNRPECGYNPGCTPNNNCCGTKTSGTCSDGCGGTVSCTAANTPIPGQPTAPPATAPPMTCKTASSEPFSCSLTVSCCSGFHRTGSGTSCQCVVDSTARSCGTHPHGSTYCQASTLYTCIDGTGTSPSSCPVGTTCNATGTNCTPVPTFTPVPTRILTLTPTPNPATANCSLSGSTCRALCLGGEGQISGDCTYPGGPMGLIQFSGVCCHAPNTLTCPNPSTDTCRVGCFAGETRSGTGGLGTCIADVSGAAYPGVCCKSPSDVSKCSVPGSTCRYACLGGEGAVSGTCTYIGNAQTQNGVCCHAPNTLTCPNPSTDTCRVGCFAGETRSGTGGLGTCIADVSGAAYPGVCCKSPSDVSKCSVPGSTCRYACLGGESWVSGTCTYIGNAQTQNGMCCHEPTSQNCPNTTDTCRIGCIGGEVDSGTDGYGACVYQGIGGLSGVGRCCKSATSLTPTPTRIPTPTCVPGGTGGTFACGTKKCCGTETNVGGSFCACTGANVLITNTPIPTPMTCVFEMSYAPGMTCQTLGKQNCSGSCPSGKICCGDNIPSVPGPGTPMPTIFQQYTCPNFPINCRPGISSCAAGGLVSANGTCPTGQLCCQYAGTTCKFSMDAVPGINCATLGRQSCSGSCPSGKICCGDSIPTVPGSGTPMPTIFQQYTCPNFPINCRPGISSCAAGGLLQGTGTCPTGSKCCIWSANSPTPIRNVTAVPTSVSRVTPPATSPNPSAPPPAPTNPGTSPSSSCNYQTLQARVRLNSTDQWGLQKSIALGGKVNLLCAYNNAGLAATNVKISAKHSDGTIVTFTTGLKSDWQPTKAGNYTVYCNSTNASCNNLQSDSALVTVAGSGSPVCKECPNSFTCFGHPQFGYAWFVPGYEMEGFGLAIDQYCTELNIAKPTWKGKGAGDADCNGVVDGSDYSMWRREFVDVSAGAEVVKSTWEADFNCDNKVGSADFSLWRRTYRDLGGI